MQGIKELTIGIEEEYQIIGTKSQEAHISFPVGRPRS